MEQETRPWGRFTVLVDAKNYKIKEIVVNSGKRLSKQRHKLRSEHWYFITGNGIVTLGDSLKHAVHNGASIDIPALALHRIENVGKDDLIFIEIQTGTYFGEDDIERFEDDFGRTGG